MAPKISLSNFLGVERQRKRVEKARKRSPSLDLRNAAVVHGDGLEAIGRLPDACADYVHVLFPDPWPKRRHKVRRMVRTGFLREVLRILKCRGILRLVTDDPDYARAMEFHAASVADFNAHWRRTQNIRRRNFRSNSSRIRVRSTICFSGGLVDQLAIKALRASRWSGPVRISHERTRLRSARRFDRCRDCRRSQGGRRRAPRCRARERAGRRVLIARPPGCRRAGLPPPGRPLAMASSIELGTPS